MVGEVEDSGHTTISNEKWKNLPKKLKIIESASLTSYQSIELNCAARRSSSAH